MALAERNDPFLSGNFAPILEEREFVDLPIKGTLPRDLEGAFIRTGPNPQFEPKGRYHSGAIDTHWHGANRFGGEAVFVARPGATGEDDGWLVTYVRDEREQRDEMVFVNAQNLAAPPEATVPIPGRIPYGFHGIWLSGEDMRSQR